MSRNIRLVVWFWFMFWSLMNMGVVFIDIFSDTVDWFTWLNGLASMFWASCAGPYPIKEPVSEKSKK